MTPLNALSQRFVGRANRPANGSTHWPTHWPTYRRQVGFTLVEVLVAVFIVALCLIAGLRAMSALAVQTQAQEMRLLALWSADNILQQQLIDGSVFALGETTRECPQGRYAFQCVISANPTPNPAFLRVIVRVYDGPKTPDAQSLAQLFHVIPKNGSLP